MFINLTSMSLLDGEYGKPIYRYDILVKYLNLKVFSLTHLHLDVARKT